MAQAGATPPFTLLQGASLFLDFDGTLVELADTPSAIAVPDSLQPLLEWLSERLDGRLAIISGRAIADLEAHLAVPGIALAGSHGLELRAAGLERPPIEVPTALAAAADAAASFAETAPGLIAERKPAGVALHFRLAPTEEGRVAAFMADLAAASGLVVQPGKMVVELRPPGAGKGDAVRTLMAIAPFAGHVPLMIGDDITDEDAFAAAAACGGDGILVGEPRETLAHWRLPDVASVAAWLAAA